MNCSKCGICCRQTEMPLSEKDIQRIRRERSNLTFFRINKEGYAQLVNRQGHCIFYDCKTCRCKIYKIRPAGCRLYPIIFSQEEGVTVDALCPEADSVKGKVPVRTRRLLQLLRTLDREGETRGARSKSQLDTQRCQTSLYDKP